MGVPFIYLFSEGKVVFIPPGYREYLLAIAFCPIGYVYPPAHGLIWLGELSDELVELKILANPVD